ncbi:unnamed protein product [Spirodela intermedia]|uniref:SHSP domain-containing protein n=1 Tax=Spirodela intermedia TaxID=51605 RepID=A0A7I8KUI5_SPIIN|nr:unnamed protein product [Spirodela intermedia]
MSPLADATVFELLHLPEAVEHLVFPYEVGAAARGRRGRPRERHRQGEEKGLGDVPVDILETPTAYTFFLDVPGLSKSDIQVTVEEEIMLVIKSSGKRKREEGKEEEEGACKYLRLERTAASFKFLRKFKLPEDSDASRISARCQNGELRVTVEKRPPPPKDLIKRKTVQVGIA